MILGNLYPLLLGILHPMLTRGTFIVDPDGILRAQEVTWYDVGRNAEETLRLLEAFDFVRKNPGVACPAGWRKGEKALRPGMDLVGKVAEALK
ncbi:hypothetical protein [Hydrogenibacillus sp. N12]|uniref:hypothetical protein n=1 Tax=Hydrogenibacillus sp. N12 TaxID=2866627 RepID=UPI001C7D0F35|nr:hypothetical protein [Hydrogenibacillus sp. N12]QZA32738.1 hypothetical protein K2M58_10820 [Hydrogenibacillus sp. N12]